MPSDFPYFWNRPGKWLVNDYFLSRLSRTVQESSSSCEMTFTKKKKLKRMVNALISPVLYNDNIIKHNKDNLALILIRKYDLLATHCRAYVRT